jgi:hypothetical protein
MVIIHMSEQSNAPRQAAVAVAEPATVNVMLAAVQRHSTLCAWNQMALLQHNRVELRFMDSDLYAQRTT